MGAAFNSDASMSSSMSSSTKGVELRGGTDGLARLSVDSLKTPTIIIFCKTMRQHNYNNSGLTCNSKYIVRACTHD